jgi:hypothetical protein
MIEVRRGRETTKEIEGRDFKPPEHIFKKCVCGVLTKIPTINI